MGRQNQIRCRLLQLQGVFIFLVSAAVFPVLVRSSLFAPLGKPTEWFTSKEGGYKLAVRRWEPSKSLSPGAEEGDGKLKGPRGTVILQHGGGFHSGYFDAFAKVLANAGWQCVAMDAIGHGYSQGPGGMAHLNRMSHATTDLERLINRERKRVGEQLPVFVFAESMGALIALPLGLRRRKDRVYRSPVDGFIIACPALKFHKETVPPLAGRMILHLLGQVIPNTSPPGVDLESSFNSAFGDLRWAEAARKDVRVLKGPPSLRVVSEAMRTAGWLRKNFSKITAPILVLQAARDTRIDPEGARELYRQVGSRDKKMVEYGEASHQLLQDNEAASRRVAADVVAWLNEDEIPSLN
uniref:Serine aminopeptidase S33 domain-containing protein n=1 Tax=Chromera velia CCMP2878 TaxID=1169474 RepID=A0A0G4GA76_9ALVE|eukprot:Cvel_20977.t1-p1 / transcript=Cvel_20977.t1 / gene=Cvel_20977 / organism=Chromera_velia_CCMP2878 / gene_product=Monoglyceride lipase, putative / transcript_product=Monoglyceride lipase, putative / location=Cvel_scaffold1929:30706-32113(+) / protein_length=352 / sequence_SO=supercontig / SO=protein_coding / is_pseudo=false